MCRFRQITFFFFTFSLFYGAYASGGIQGADAETGDCKLAKRGSGVVAEIINNDTVRLKNGEKVRLVGITARVPKPLREFRPTTDLSAAQALLKRLLIGRQVELRGGGRARDRYNRHLAHLYFSRNGETLWVQRILVQRGLARVASFKDNRPCISALLRFEAQAREKLVGHWGGDNLFKILKAEERRTLLPLLHSFQIVEGVVHGTATVRGRLFINFEEDWRRDFTVTIAAKDLRRFKESAVPIEGLAGHRLRVRGWIERWNGPVIKVTHPEQIELLDDGPMDREEGGERTPKRKSAHPVLGKRIVLN